MSTLINALKECEIVANEVETFKNGVRFIGYQIDNGTNVKPVIFHSPEESIESFVSRAKEIATMPVPQMDFEKIASREALLTNTFLCIQKKGKENICKRFFLDLEVYVRLGVDFPNGTRGSVKVTQRIIENAGITEDILFQAAVCNSEKKASVLTVAEALGMAENILDEDLFYVGTYQDKAHGAGIMVVTSVLHNFCQEKGYSKLYILPSSTEEILLLPNEMDGPVFLADMVNSVNMETVHPEMQLNPTVYLYDDYSRTVKIACSYND